VRPAIADKYKLRDTLTHCGDNIFKRIKFSSILSPYFLLMKKLLLFAVPLSFVLSFSAFKCSTTDGDSAIEQGSGKWAAFADYKKGDTIIFFSALKWKPGTIMETGKPYNATAKNAETSELKFEIAEGGDVTWPDWKEFSQVVKPNRESWWTDFFVGDWNLGEAMAVNTYTKGNNETTHFDYQKATEGLRVLPNGTYTWKKDGKVITGKWIALSDGPGIVLKTGYKGLDWKFINQSNAITMHIRKLENGRLFPDGGTELSKAATRPMK